MATLENSRLVFGYLSKVCPNLEDLTVRYLLMRLKLAGGLCLLARALASLEPKYVDRLKLLAWSPQTTQGRQEQSMGQKNLDYMIDGVDMRNLGHMADILELMNDWRSKKWACWPLMEEISVLKNYREV
ncbi:hypothetical protein BGZ82_010357 [Podila clonocystis]|nr:hypothetical protein BGZ82_010357 [Podila clonocystis]